MAHKSLGEFWRLDRVTAETGFKKTYIYLQEQRGRFPKRIKIGRAALWSSAQVEDWKRAMAAGEEWRP